MNKPIIIGIDVSEDRSVAVRLTHEDYNKYPTSKAKDFFDICDFHDIKDTKSSMELLIHLGDIYCFEPTGRYSKNIEDELRRAGKEVRIIKNNMIIAIRKNCGWDMSDDEHDAVAIAYDGWRRELDQDLGYYNRVRIPELETAYQLFLQKERINRRIRQLVNHAKNLLKTEAPCLRKIDFCGEYRITPLWTWIAGRDTKNRYKTRLTEDIGSYKRTEKFSEELIILARTIDDMQRERARIRQCLQEIIKIKKFDKYNQGFDWLQFGVYDRVITLCQIYPFEQFLTPDLKEKRSIFKRKKTKKGNPVTKRIGYRHFHCLMGRGLFEESSGQTTIKVVRGNKEIKLTLMQWGISKIIREKVGSKGILRKSAVLKLITESYWKEADPAYAQLKSLMAMDDAILSKIDEIVDDKPQNRFFKEIITDAIQAKRKPSKALKASKTQAKLKEYLASRAIDKAIKILWKILLVIWQGKEINPDLLMQKKP